MEKLKCLYISRACSQKMYDSLLTKPSFAAVKFNRMLIKGLVKNNVDITQLMIVDRSIEQIGLVKDGDIEILCTPEINKFKKIIISFKFSFQFFKRNKNAILICDYLNYTATLTSLIAAKLARKKSICIVTDLPEFIGDYNKKKNTFKEKLFVKVGYYILHKFRLFVFLTEQMSQRLQNVKYEIIEGVYDEEFEDKSNYRKEKKIMYAGSLHKEYGIDSLISGFITSKHASNFELNIYGAGNYKMEIEKICKIHSNVHYCGTVSNKVILEEEKKSYLLINPRPSQEEYCEFSFPSKNIEYMASGTPLLTTLLPGMPDGYNEHVFLLHDESAIGIARKIDMILDKSDTELKEFGLKARIYILKYKNSEIQTKKILRLLS